MFYEIDFLEVGRSGSGDAISIRYSNALGENFIHVVDGGYIGDGEKISSHIKSHYGNASFIDHVVLTHPDGDHAAGLIKILEEFDVGRLWINRPWEYVDDLLSKFDYEYTRTGLIQRLRRDFPYTAQLESIALQKEIPISAALQGAQIGPFTVLAPSLDRYLELVVASEKTPDEARAAMMEGNSFVKAARYLRKIAVEWGQESLKGETEGTSRENESSIVQFAELCDQKILLTADAGIGALEEAYDFAVAQGVSIPGIDKFQIPHHGSRRNLSSRILDLWLGPRLDRATEAVKFTAVVSANQKDPDHPRKAVVRAMIHRGGRVIQTDGTIRTHRNGPDRGWSSVTPLPYPQDMEE